MMLNPMHAPAQQAPSNGLGFYGTADSNFFARVVAQDAAQQGGGGDAQHCADLVSKLAGARILSLAAAAQAAEAHCGLLHTVVPKALAFADAYLQQQQQQQMLPAPARGGAPLPTMSRVSIAVIHAYTQDSALYAGLNAAMAGYGEGGRAALRYYLPMVKLLLPAMAAQPKLKCCLYRGVSRACQCFAARGAWRPLPRVRAGAGCVLASVWATPDSVPSFRAAHSAPASPWWLVGR